jgi:hypothetical protein
MGYRHLLLATTLLCASAAAQTVAPPPAQSGDRWLPVTAAPAPGSSTAAYHDPLSEAANQAQRFNFNEAPAKDPAPPDQSPVHVIINNGYGPHVNCAPMGPLGACH